MLAVTFTGNVINDFTTSTPSVYLTDPNNHQPVIEPPGLADIVKVSGFAIQNIAVNYDQAGDTLNIGFLGANNPKTGLPVIAGDADNNGNNSTTDPAAAPFGVIDWPAISQTENYNAVIDLSGGTNTATESIFAGIPNQATPGYANATYVVAPAVFSAGTAIGSANPQPGAELKANEGNIFMPFNDPRHGQLEISITHFSEVYKAFTGKTLSPTSVISIGASAGSGSDGGTDEQIFNFIPAPVGTFTTPPPTVPPPVIIKVPVPVPVPVVVPVEIFEPTVLINPHENRHVNTAHFDNVRVTVLSSASFSSVLIDPATVELDGAKPIAWFHKIQLRDGLQSETFVFKGTDINLPGGFTVATITGQTYTGTTFTGSQLIFNRNDSFYSQAQINARDARLARIGATVAQENGTSTTATNALSTASTPLQTATTPATGTAATGTTIKLTPRQQAAANAEVRRQALYATLAARSFTGSGGSTAGSGSSSSSSTQSAALLAHDLALQSLSSGSQSAT